MDITKMKEGYTYVSVWQRPEEGSTILCGWFSPVANGRHGWWLSDFYAARSDRMLQFFEEKHDWQTPDGWLAKNRVLSIDIGIPEDYKYWVVMRTPIRDENDPFGPHDWNYDVLFQPAIQKCHWCKQETDAWKLTETLMNPEKDIHRVDYRMLCEECRGKLERKELL